MIVNGFGFSAAFFFLAACALGALGIYFFAVPESRNYHVPEADEDPGTLVSEEARA
jgi:predicted MFS family arabinose efflux permease